MSGATFQGGAYIEGLGLDVVCNLGLPFVAIVKELLLVVKELLGQRPTHEWHSNGASSAYPYHKDGGITQTLPILARGKRLSNS